MTDHSVIARDELHESEASEALGFCFDNASPEKSYLTLLQSMVKNQRMNCKGVPDHIFVDGLVCFISLCLLVFVFLNAGRRDRNCPTSASTVK